MPVCNTQQQTHLRLAQVLDGSVRVHSHTKLSCRRNLLKEKTKALVLGADSAMTEEVTYRLGA